MLLKVQKENRIFTKREEREWHTLETEADYINGEIKKAIKRAQKTKWSVTVCQSHMPTGDNEALAAHLKENYGIAETTINPLGPWTGGTDVDCGATNRKLGSDMGDGVTGGGLHGKDLSKADVSVNIVCYLKAVASGQVVTACCSIGDESVTFVYADGRTETERFEKIVEDAREYIHGLGGFEAFAMWGLIRP